MNQFITLTLSFLLFQNIALAESIRILEMKGSATETIGKTIYPLKIGEKLHLNSQIKVNAESLVIIGLGKDVVTKLGPNSLASISEKNKKDWELELVFGISASAIRNPEKRPDHFQVRSRSVVMGVRGTVFYTESLENKPIFLCTCKGTVKIEDQNGKQLDSITATHHDRPITLEEDTQGKNITVKTAPMGSGHSDADVVYLENLLSKL